jgi:RimJ/RimL family protein N-acetyltransferase
LIKVAEQSDYEIVKILASELMKATVYSNLFKGYTLTEQMYNSYVTKLNEKACIIVLDNDTKEPIGFAAFDIIPWINSDAPIKIARLAYIYVREQYRGKGYGKEINIAFEHWGKQVGANCYSRSHKSEGYSKVETIYMKEVN